MTTAANPVWTDEQYEDEATRYYESLPMEHFMESTEQSKQHFITESSFLYLKRLMPLVHCYTELLILYFHNQKIRHVVPDSYIVLSAKPWRRLLSYNLAQEQPDKIVWAMEYVSKRSRKKDFGKSRAKYEHELQIPHYLIFDPRKKKLVMYELNSHGYVEMKPNAQGRYLIPELEIEVGLLDGWARFWFRGELLPITEELADQVNVKDQQLQSKDQQLQSKDRQLQSKDRQLETTLASLRQQITVRAQKVGRDDVLAGVAVADAPQLIAWLGEL